MSLTHAERLSSPVLKRAASRSASGWLTAFKLRRGRFASESELCTSRGEQLPPPRPTARMSGCTSASEAVRTSLDCAPERLRPLRPRSYERKRVAPPVYAFAKQLRLLSAPHFRLAQMSQCPSELYGRGLVACKACAKDSCRNFISKNVLEILPRKILKFIGRL